MIMEVGATLGYCVTFVGSTVAVIWRFEAATSTNLPPLAIRLHSLRHLTPSEGARRPPDQWPQGRQGGTGGLVMACWMAPQAIWLL